METIPVQSGRLHRWALLLVCLAAFALRFQGISWPAFHPDEHPIGGWVDKVARGVPLKEKLYAQGFFRMVKPAVWISRGFDYAANAGAFQRGLKDRVRRTGGNAIMVARWFNVWAGTLVCLAGYLLVRRITRLPWAGVFGAALLGLAQFPVEHSHYAETDIAMLLALATTLWLMAVTAETRRKFVFVLAALAGGFAAGTKFTLFLLLPAILALGITFDPRPLSPKACLRAGGLLLAGAVCFLLGFLLAMPEAMDTDWFFKGLAYEKARVYGETALNMGPLRGDRQVRYLLHARELLDYLKTLGWGWLALSAAGLPCLALRAYRRFWTITLLFPLLFLFYWIFKAPWVRSQEFMAFLPACAVLAALPLVVLWRAGRGWRNAAVLVLAACALIANGIGGCRTASLFAWTDTRLLAKQWLETHLPAQRVVAVENYADPAHPDTGRPPVCINKIERTGLPYLLAQNADYLLRTASNSGRGLRNPLTGALHPGAQKLFDEFALHSERLRVWAPLPPQGLATFVAPVIELYGLRTRHCEHAVDLELPQPLWLNNYFDGEKGRQTFFPIGRKLSAAAGLLIDRLPRAIAVGGPEAPREPVYIILNTVERPATVIIRGFGQMRRVALNPNDAAVVPLERSPWRPRLSQFEEITLCTERVRDVLFIPCFARVAFTPEEAARICLDLGAEEVFWKTFSDEDFARLHDPITAYLLAARSARWDLAARFEAAAERVAAGLAAAENADPSTAFINGNSGYYYNELARVRMADPPRDVVGLREGGDGRLIIKQTLVMDVLDLTEPLAPGSGNAPLYEAVLQLPVRLARGRYTFCAEVMARSAGPAAEEAGLEFDFHCGRPERRVARHAAGKPEEWMPLTFEIQAAREVQPCLIVRTRNPARLYLRNTEIRWNLASMLASVRDDLNLARAAQAEFNGNYAEALRYLSGFDPEAFGWNELEIRQLRLAVARGLGDKDALREAAQRLLELAPGDYASLQALAETNPAFQAVAAELAGNLKAPVDFGADMRLVGFSLNLAGRKAQCVWEARKNETPPLAASFWIRRHGEWRKRQTRILSGRQWLAKGERVILEVKLNDAFAGYAPDAMALGLETAVQWHSGALPADGCREPVVSFSDLLRR